MLVCDRCLRACCWYGEFMCGEAAEAGTGILTTAQMKRLGREHPDFWSRKKLIEIYGGPSPGFSENEPDLTPQFEKAMAEK